MAFKGFTGQVAGFFCNNQTGVWIHFDVDGSNVDLWLRCRAPSASMMIVAADARRAGTQVFALYDDATHLLAEIQTL